MSHKKVTIISVLELRQNFGAVRQKLAQGQSYIIAYRGEPIAELTPASADTIDMFFTAPSSAVSNAARLKKNTKVRKQKRVSRG